MNGPPILACASSFTFLRVFVRPTDCLRVRLSVFMSMFCLILSFSALVYATLLSLILSVCVSLSLSPLFSLSRSLSSPLSLFSLALSLALSSRSPSPPSLSLSHFLPSLLSLYRSLSLSSVLQPFDIIIDQPLYFSLSLLWFYSFLHLFPTCMRRLNRVFHFSRVSILI